MTFENRITYLAEYWFSGIQFKTMPDRLSKRSSLYSKWLLWKTASWTLWRASLCVKLRFEIFQVLNSKHFELNAEKLKFYKHEYEVLNRDSKSMLALFNMVIALGAVTFSVASLLLVIFHGNIQGHQVSLSLVILVGAGLLFLAIFLNFIFVVIPSSGKLFFIDVMLNLSSETCNMQDSVSKSATEVTKQDGSLKSRVERSNATIMSDDSRCDKNKLD